MEQAKNGSKFAKDDYAQHEQLALWLNLVAVLWAWGIYCSMVLNLSAATLPILCGTEPAIGLICSAALLHCCTLYTCKWWSCPEHSKWHEHSMSTALKHLPLGVGPGCKGPELAGLVHGQWLYQMCSFWVDWPQGEWPIFCLNCWKLQRAFS